MSLHFSEESNAIHSRQRDMKRYKKGCTRYKTDAASLFFKYAKKYGCYFTLFSISPDRYALPSMVIHPNKSPMAP
jgi:hypothetical protein